MSRGAWWAPWVVPVAAAPLRNALIEFEDGHITEVTAGVDEQTAARDPKIRSFPCSIIAPGFVNAHAHIEYGAYAGLTDALTFDAWIHDHILRKRRLHTKHMEASAAYGAAQCAASGITFVADASYAGLSPSALEQTGLRGRVYLEVFSGPEPAEQIARDLDERLAALYNDRPTDSLVELGISPHAPYTVARDLYEEIAGRALPWTTHLLESSEERELYDSDSGPLLDPIRLGRRTADHWNGSPVEALRELWSPSSLVVHGNYLRGDEIEALASAGAPLVTCPRSNAALGCAPLDSERAERAGLVLALGTDSPASAGVIDMFAEMRAWIQTERSRAARATAAPAQHALRLATFDAAQALGLPAGHGQILPGGPADLLVCNMGGAVGDPVAALVGIGSPERVVEVVVSGQPIWRNDRNRLAEAEAAAAEARTLLALPTKL